MARILMACVPAYGLANPSFPVTRALVQAGHEVDYLIHDTFRETVQRCGAGAIPHAPYLDGPLGSVTTLARFGRRLFHDLNAAILRRGPAYDAVIACGINPQIPWLQAALDVPVVNLSPVFLQNERTFAHLVSIATGMPRPMRTVMGTTRLRRAVSRVVGPAVLDTRSRDILSILTPQSAVLNISPASAYYQPFAEDFDDTCVFMGPSPTIPKPDESFPMERLREHPGPVVYGTLGTVFNSWTGFFRTLADAFAGSEILVVLTTGNKERVAQVGPVPDNVILRSFVPQADVLGEADVCFTHGGFGSATDAVSLGVPPILTPTGADQYFNAYRIQELEAGRVLTKTAFCIDTVRRLAYAVLSEGRSAGLRRLQDSFHEAGGPARAVTAIEAVIGGRPVT